MNNSTLTTLDLERLNNRRVLSLHDDMNIDKKTLLGTKDVRVYAKQ